MNRSLRVGCFAIGLFFARVALAYDAFNNFGPSDTYDTTTGYTVAGSSADFPFSPHIVGSRFTAEATGILAVIRIALKDQFTPGFNQVDVRLHHADLAGEIGPIMAAFTRSGLPPSGGSDPPETITSFDPAVVLTAGEQYWIVVAPGDETTEAGWNWSLDGAGDLFADSTNNGLSFSYSERRRGVMRVEVISIPEPPARELLIVATAGIRPRRRRIA
jgi:hypothetical protein